MTIKEVHAKAGPLSGYLLYILLMAGWYFLDNAYTAISPLFPESQFELWLNWLVRIVIVPFFLAGVFGGIHDQQQAQESWDASGLFTGIRKNYWRMLLVNFLTIVFFMVVTIAAVISGVTEQIDFADNKVLLGIISIPYYALTLFWLTSITVERKVFHGLGRALQTLLFNPYALVIGIAWGALAFADTVYFDYLNTPPSLTVNALRAVALAIIRILAVSYALALYKQIHPDLPNELTESGAAPKEEDGLVNVSFGFALASFIPLLHLVALILGAVATLRKKRFGIRLALAWGLGGFFTLFYLFMLVGWLVSGFRSFKATDYAFLSAVEPRLAPQVLLLEQGSSDEVAQQLAPQVAASSDHSWATDCALAIAQAESFDQSTALGTFWRAAEKQPTRGEFYYLYGVALLNNGQTERAAEQFQTALKYDPGLNEAARYLELINSAYNTPELVSSLLYVVILLMLFAFHEYGHAWVAWKLGDDTAERQGRLTLNPVRHLDLFGSIILPGILLLQQSGMVFGWAKPVPVDPRNFKNPLKDHMRVAFAGPAVNLLVSMAACLALGALLVFIRLLWPETLALNLAAPFAPVSLVGPANARLLVVIILFIKQLFYTSLLLGFLNLIPVPPLDGSWILSGLLPARLSGLFEQTRRFGFLLFLLLVMTPALDYLLGLPVSVVYAGLELLVSAMRFG